MSEIWEFLLEHALMLDLGLALGCFVGAVVEWRLLP